MAGLEQKLKEELSKLGIISWKFLEPEHVSIRVLDIVAVDLPLGLVGGYEIRVSGLVKEPNELSIRIIPCLDRPLSIEQLEVYVAGAVSAVMRAKELTKGIADCLARLSA